MKMYTTGYEKGPVYTEIVDKEISDVRIVQNKKGQIRLYLNKNSITFRNERTGEHRELDFDEIAALCVG